MEQAELKFDQSTFSSQVAEAKKQDGMKAAAVNRENILSYAQQIAAAIAVSRENRTCTADDVYQCLIQEGIDPALLGNAAGAIFRGNRWHFTQRWEKSKRVSNHARAIRVWRFVS